MGLIIALPDLICVTPPLSGTDLVCCCATALVGAVALFPLRSVGAAKLGEAGRSTGLTSGTTSDGSVVSAFW